MWKSENFYVKGVFRLVYNSAHTVCEHYVSWQSLQCCNIVYLQHGGANYLRQNCVTDTTCRLNWMLTTECCLLASRVRVRTIVGKLYRVRWLDCGQMLSASGWGELCPDGPDNNNNNNTKFIKRHNAVRLLQRPVVWVALYCLYIAS